MAVNRPIQIAIVGSFVFIPRAPVLSKQARDYLGVSFNSLLVGGVLGLIEAVPLSVRT